MHCKTVFDIIIGLVTFYPFAKRITHWPQAVLGTTFNIGVLMGYAASAKYAHLGLITFPWFNISCLSMYLAGISWTLIYDTIYAHQDREEDAQLGNMILVNLKRISSLNLS